MAKDLATATEEIKSLETNAARWGELDGDCFEGQFCFLAVAVAIFYEAKSSGNNTPPMGRCREDYMKLLKYFNHTGMKPGSNKSNRPRGFWGIYGRLWLTTFVNSGTSTWLEKL